MENKFKYICEVCESSNVKIDDSCNYCAVVDIKCLDCGEESLAIREDIQNEIDDETEKILKNGIDPEISKDFREIISEFMEDIPSGHVLDENERNELFDNLMDTMNKSKEKEK